jgi:hypothetical protein
MYIILKMITDDIEEFIVFNRITNSEVARYSTYDEAFKDLLSR